MGTHLLIAPEGRYRIVNDKLEAMTREGVAAEFHGKTLDRRAFPTQIAKLPLDATSTSWYIPGGFLTSV